MTLVNGISQFRAADFMPVDLDVRALDGGVITLRSRIPLRDHDPNLARAFARRAAEKGDAPALLWRDLDDRWVGLSYRDFKREVDSAAAWLRRSLAPRSVILIIGENSRSTAVATFAAHAANMVAAPVGPMYALIGAPYARLLHVIRKQRPALALLECGPPSAPAAELLREHGVRIVSTDPEGLGGQVTSFADLLREPAPSDADALTAALDVDAPAQHVLTSGSSGLPKVVPQSLRMMAASLAQQIDTIGGVAAWDQEMVEWGPWHHTAGAATLRACMVSGGAFYIDAGKPLPHLFKESIRNLREIPLTKMHNGPSAYALLVEALEADSELRETFFRKLRIMVSGGAALSQQVYDQIQKIAVAETGYLVPCVNGYGMTETVAACVYTHWPTENVGLGLPVPDVTMKLVPYGEYYEIRLKGPNIAKGYLDDPEQNSAAFDDDGFFKTGDLARLADPQDVSKGLLYGGRASEEFKLSNATWVSGGQLREGLLKALNGKASDLVLADDGWPFLCALVWATHGTSLDDVAEVIRTFNQSQHGAASRVARVTLLNAPPDPLRNELTDKGTVVRRAILDNRKQQVAELLSDCPGDDVRIL